MQPLPAQPTAQSSDELAKAYKPSEHEAGVWQRWLDANAFHARPQRVLSGEAKPYAIFIPPPNVTARLHLGHALNNTLQDILIRAHRMRGFEALWMPGTDHAGIATQAVVEKRVLQEEGKRRHDFSRVAFVAKIQAFKDEYEAQITEQLQRMGCSCDWARQRFTMDEQCAHAVREAFFRLFKQGLIYRGKRLVNWDPALQTAVADDECYDEEIDGAFYYLRYPLKTASPSLGQGTAVTWSHLFSRGFPRSEAPADIDSDSAAFLTVATTRPETYLGDTAVAINPNDPRAASVKGLCAQLPLVGRVIPIIEDNYVVLPERFARNDEEKNDPKAKMATGFLKVTPAHDPNDWEIGQRHKLPAVNIFAPDGSISTSHGWSDPGEATIFVGLPRERARKAVVKELDARGLFEGSRPTRHSVKHSDRSKAIVEPYLSDQWYVRVTDDRMAPRANRVLHEGKLSFHPSRYAKSYEHWHENIRDWCISRQLWWGHRIPVWSKELSPAEASRLQDESTRERAVHIIRRDDGSVIAYCCVAPGHASVEHELEGQGYKQDEDVLDTWFSSGLWPLSTLGWPDPAKFNAQLNAGLLEAFNPSSVLCTAREIITLWVSRMVMFNMLLKDSAGANPLPFRDVFIHAVIQDGFGQKMSKSLGNGVDPLDIIESHGADAMRFTLCHMTTQTQDVRMPVDLICPHTGAVFQPATKTIAGGYSVPSPIQNSPKEPGKKMVTAYGVASGEAKPTPEMPLARNTSSKFDIGRNLANKLWNASRFTLSMLMGTTHSEGEVAPQSLIDRWMLSRLADGIARADSAIASYEFSEYAQVIYDVFWRDFCDWYLEGVKPTIASSPSQRAVLRASLDALLRITHPVMPFVTETLHDKLRTLPASSVRGLVMTPTSELLCLSAWPICDASLRDESVERRFDELRELVTVIRDVRARQQVKPSRRITLKAPHEGTLGDAESRALLCTFAGLETIEPLAEGAGVRFTHGGRELLLTNLHDLQALPATGGAQAERERLAKLVGDLEKSISTLQGRLSNPGYAAKAPPAMVQQTKDQLQKATEELAAAKHSLSHLEQ